MRLRFGKSDDDELSGRDLLGAALAAAPRDTRWEVSRGERVELRDETGELLAWSKADRSLSSVRDPAGRLLVQIGVGIKISGSDVAAMAVTGAILGSNSPPVVGGFRNPVEVPPLTIKAVPGSLTFAQVVPVEDGESLVELLPSGRLNDKLVGRALGPDEVARIRQRSPLRYRQGTAHVDALTDASGVALARVSLGGAEQSEPSASWSIEVMDNDLPAAWLFAILLVCTHLRGGDRTGTRD